MTNLKIITVVNNFQCFDKTIKNNKFMNKYELFVFDNTQKNLPITKRYNSFLEEQIFSGRINDSWLVFCHQDFGFLQDPITVLENENTKNILGIIGVKLQRNLLLKKRRKWRGALWQGQGDFIMPSTKLKNDIFKIRGMKFKVINQTVFAQSRNKIKHGFVDTLDCCCLIAHSSTIKKYSLRFDEDLPWDMYAEDFCLNAKSNHNINTKTTPIESYHISLGNTKSQSFNDALNFVKNKYPKKTFAGTCFY